MRIMEDEEEVLKANFFTFQNDAALDKMF